MIYVHIRLVDIHLRAYRSPSRSPIRQLGAKIGPPGNQHIIPLLQSTPLPRWPIHEPQALQSAPQGGRSYRSILLTQPLSQGTDAHMTSLTIQFSDTLANHSRESG